MTGRYRILAGPGSPYSHKVRAVMRYRRIPHDWVIPLGGFDGASHTPERSEIARAGKRLLPTVQYPDGAYWNDSTPIIEDLETRHADLGRSVLPPSPAERFAARLIEDFADEWLAVVLMSYRWTSDADVAFCARRQMAGWLGAVPEDELEAAIGRFTARQQFVRAAIGGSESSRGALDAEYRALLPVLEAGLSRNLFLFGERPSIADFGLYGMLSQFQIDPTPSAIMRAEAMRTFQWTLYMDDLSGHDGDWSAGRAIGETAGALIALAAEGFLPFMLANQAAVAAGDRSVAFAVRGAEVKAFARPYPAAVWLWLKQMYAALAPADRAALAPLLEPTGFAAALQAAPGELEAAAPFRPI